jgi:hydroxypyruvate isomerase
MYRLSANIELLFTEFGDHPDRVRAAADHGFEAVEIWGLQGKDLPALGRALEQAGASLITLVGPRAQFMLDPNHEPFYQVLRDSVNAAQDLGCAGVVVSSGIGNPGIKRAEQLRRLVDVFSRAAEITEGTRVMLLLENLNTRVDHPGTLLDLTSECLDVIRGVGAPSFRLLYDLYHSLTMGEDPSVVLKDAIDLVPHVQIADVPGRGEPGTGDVDWPARLAELRQLGYSGIVGLEFTPSKPSVEAVRYIQEIARDA